MTDEQRLAFFAKYSADMRAIVESDANPDADCLDMAFGSAPIWPCQTSRGLLLKYQGLQTTLADIYAHVCFDRNPDIGRSIHLMPTPYVQKKLYMAQWRQRPIMGTRDDASSQSGIGAGYLFEPKYLRATSYKLTSDLLAGNERLALSQQAELAVLRLMKRLYDVKRAIKINGSEYMDFIVRTAEQDIAIEVKCRLAHQDQDAIFVQTHERNPDRRFT